MDINSKKLLIGFTLMCCAGCAVSIQHGVTSDFQSYQSLSQEPNLTVIRESRLLVGVF